MMCAHMEIPKVENVDCDDGLNEEEEESKTIPGGVGWAKGER